MKNILFVSILLSTISNAQEKFILTPTGLKNSTDTTKEFIVKGFNGKSQTQLFNQIELFVNKAYFSPKDAISRVENESITINGFSEGCVRYKKNKVFNMNYRVNIEFKNEKIRVPAPTFRLTSVIDPKQRLHLVDGGDFYFGGEGGIWNNSLKLKSKMAKEDIENWFNNYVAEILKSVNDKTDW